MSKLIDRIKLKFIKKEFDKIYNLVLENSNRTNKRSFSDGTPYTKKELNKRIFEIAEKLQKLKVTENLGLMYVLTSKAGFLELGIERLIQLYDREPEFIKNVIIGCHPYSNTFLRSTYYENYSANMSIDEVIKEWFEIAAKQLEDGGGLHKFIEIKNGEKIIGTDATGYGENFIKTYPEFFVEDRSLPEKIKQKFYNGELTIEDYEKYDKEFEGILVGIGISDATDFLDTVGIRNFTEIIKEYSDAMKYFQTGGWGSSLDRRSEEFKDLKDIEDIKKKFEDIINDEVEGKRKSVLRGNTMIVDIRDTDFLRRRLPEFILADDAPQELVDKYYNRSVALTDLSANPEWIKWLEGKDDFVKSQVIDEYEYDEWVDNEASNYNEIVNDYMSRLYEDKIRKDIIDRRQIDNFAITDTFKERNPDVFFDNLPRKLKFHFENYDWSFEDVFKLSSTMKNLLRDKQIHMAFPFGLERGFCERNGGDFGAFEVYEKYAGLMNMLVNSRIDVDEYKEVEILLKQAIFNEKQSPIANTRKENDKYLILEEKIKRAGLQAIKNSNGKYDDRVPEEYKREHAEYFLDVDSPQELRRIFYREVQGMMSFELLRNNPEYLTFLQGKSIRQLFGAEYREFFDYCNNQDEAMRLGIKYGYYVKHLTFYEGEELSKCSEDLLIARMHMRIITDSWDYSDLPDDFKSNYPELFLMDEDLEKMKDIEEGIRDNIKTIFYQKLMSFELLKNYPVLIDIMKSKDACLLHDGKLEDILSKFTEVVGDREKAFSLITGRFAEVFDKIAESPNYEDDLQKAITYYKEVGFIPDMVVIDKLPKDKIKGFVLNRKLWREIVKERKDITPDVLGSLLEAAVVMGVFETKEFTRNGKVMLQGNGEAGFKNLRKLLNYSPRYYRAPFSIDEEPGVSYAGRLHVKQGSDCAEEMLYEMLEKAAIARELGEEFVEGLLDGYDVNRIIEDIGYKHLEVEDCFEEDGEDYYHCIVDRNMDSKRKVILKMLGIKDDEVLLAEEYNLIAQCNEQYLKKAFKEIKYSESAKTKRKQEDKDENIRYKFNISQQGDSFVIGDKYNIDEEESKANKKLFDYVKFLMAEHGLEAEAARLGANNDRSNIDLELDKEKMDVICKATNKISQSILDMYSRRVDVWKIKDGVKTGYINDRRIHQLFDGMKMEYNKSFSNFILNNIGQIVEDESLLNKINPIQEQIIEMDKDPDYAGVELTPVMVLKAINKTKYTNKKVGFEKGEELAQKFAFSQEYFNVAQEVWSEARKRESSTIPRVYGDEGRYSYEVLRLDDVTGIYAGNITNCCQKLGGVGETAMLHSMQEKHGRVFVVRDSARRIISQSWLWRNGDTICFDNVEIPNFANNKENQDAIYEIMKTVAKELCDKDAEVVEKLVAEGKISQEKAETMKARKVTVGQGNTDIDAIWNNRDVSIVEHNCKSPIGTGKAYKGIDEDRLYISDSIDQIILYEAKGSTKEKEQPNIPIHYDENIEKNCMDITNSEFKMMREIEKEIEGKTDIGTIEVLLERYNVAPEELNAVIGTDWFMLYSEKDEDITVHKMLKSPSSGIMKKSIKEQREAVKMLMDKGKNISMEFENDRVHRAAKSMVRNMQKRYTMKVADERRRISVRDIQTR